MKQIHITCPYCQSRAFLRPASVVYGEKNNDPTAKVYVCGRFPACDAYVAAHKQTLRPMGTLANRALRRQRILAHDAISHLCVSGKMSRKDAYRWLQAKLNLSEADMHIGQFSEFRCSQIISICNQFCENAHRAAS